TNNYNASFFDVFIDVSSATPAFSNLSSPTITAGTASTTLGGRIAAGTLIPSGSVTISAGSASTSATIAGDGPFSAPLNTSRLAAGTYTITYDYAGSTNFNGAHDTSHTLTVNSTGQGTAGKITGGGSVDSGVRNFGFVVQPKVQNGVTSFIGNLEFQDKAK